MLEILLGYIPEAIYFALFMIFTKQLKEKRILFIILMIAEYLLLKSFLHFTMWFQILYTFLTYVILKMLYKEKSQITDIFTFAIASFTLIIFNLILSPFHFANHILYVILVRVIMFVFLFIFRNKFYKIQTIYKKLWNRNDKTNKRIKSLTFRSLNLVIFNIMFYIVNIGMLYALYLNSK